MLIMAAITIMSVNLFAQDSTVVNPKKIKKHKTEKVKYSCPMHPGVIMDGPGKCTTCGMDLTLSPKEKMKREVMKMYACPMHPEETSSKAGKCSICNMDLKEVKKESKVYTCPMHPDVTSDKPGKCSKCGMDLKEKSN